MKKLKSLFILAISSLLILSACNSNIPSETPNEPNTPDLPVEDKGDETPDDIQTPVEDEPFETEGTKQELQIKTQRYLDSEYTVIDGKVIEMQKNYSNGTVFRFSETIENASYVANSRFVFCEDGSVIDLYQVIDHPYVVFDFEDISKTSKVINIETDWEMREILYTENGKAYFQYGEMRELDAVKTTRLWVDDKTVVWIGLNSDGTISFYNLKFEKLEDVFPEIERWTDIADIAVCKNVVIGLKNDGSVVSFGTEFSPENVVMIDIIDSGSTELKLPVALTADGKLIFGEYPELEVSNDLNEPPYEIGNEPFPYQYAIKQAEKFADVFDFTYICGSRFIILVQKSDGSLWATYNDYYDPEYINILGRNDFLAD